MIFVLVEKEESEKLWQTDLGMRLGGICRLVCNSWWRIRSFSGFTNNSEEIGSLTLHFCDACNDAIDREVRWESEGATHRKDQVICPFCGYEYDPYESLRFDEDETTDAACECCGRHFKVEVTTVRYYSTRRSISEMPPDWQPNGEDT